MADAQASKTTKTMAYLLMGLFGFCLIAVLITAIWFDEDKRWFTAFKDGFAFLAGALATIIGYYFGNRNTDVAFEKAREATDRVKDATAKATAAENKAEAFREQILDVTTMNDPENPTRSPISGEDALDSPGRTR